LKKEKYFLKELLKGLMYYFTASTDNRYRGEETFSSKIDGAELIKRYTLEKTISKCNAYDLMGEIILHPHLPVTNEKGEDDVETDKIWSKDEQEIANMYSIIRRMTLSETEKGLPKFVFPQYEAGVCFVTKDEVFGVFSSKQEVLTDEKIKEYLNENPHYRNKFFSDLFDINFSNLKFDPQDN
jgi:hypothetical protein